MNNPRRKSLWNLPLAGLAGVLLAGAAYFMTPAIARRQAARLLPPLPVVQPAPPPAPLAPTALYEGTQDVPVLMYHDVTETLSVYFDVTTREFRQQMTALKKAGAHVIPLADL